MSPVEIYIGAGEAPEITVDSKEIVPLSIERGPYETVIGYVEDRPEGGGMFRRNPGSKSAYRFVPDEWVRKKGDTYTIPPGKEIQIYAKGDDVPPDNPPVLRIKGIKKTTAKSLR
ncbi:hypothetical protein A2630_03760 [Candidatus Woesebacteria bacterium RIFCSPHIGHO2_01_FULL_44_10]|uniref:Uncharacterized protein n=1 Tax=Candidatus Woesebacteria bacterium RIFCSPLOWO2_01_FULL_44_14 TaxID=1802525 RepID=A0A1F8C3P2_9BACT|nr:MAG: hypothetical protein A2630_03760 [Candidatus Woesebacteria bacterium RIFCSPHIGHO2_01_FULL_44_10]OGM55631.1 MAG: hypothetical protein A3F62_02360 [Candidatus Woesebacteria bacterium RIFCSPHIGHO2_12_FULL_44_11]OGM70904.1 MAG: hypothetical protein A2975_01350 [Candidatus Woesebacteria bacterium RIFCSPLOWO2_01_FULL_44_14]